ncbi:8-oxo-dGTP pyrophosphatase MutT (NUDIX family) [Paenibacillus shirakamiensis]|uniref:8-oxo-dGTP pyrophosphatase MutT (NUDIX family) n=1 Tax=Paenibacillus shirakamiensis TaxID=1265935 RepID=A0ABS4JDW7_9BACL|nr:NUDIX domain-containing protein [Paenibacillus shirakamiensis]MBP1999888.1 8-oxo-dGTP pyrophosphatase MutT (NUDIX family) [Paenibacillus shirakamiensis]
MAHIIDKIAWIHLENHKVLVARSKDKETFYLPGGKREVGEHDMDTLVREIEEELSVHIQPESAAMLGIFEAKADGKSVDVKVNMTCYTADYTGDLAPASEIEEIQYFSYEDRHRVSAVSQHIFDELRKRGWLQ